MSTALKDAGFCKSVIGILVRRLGGKVTLTQAEFDEIPEYHLLEGMEVGKFHLRAAPREETPPGMPVIPAAGPH